MINFNAVDNTLRRQIRRDGIMTRRKGDAGREMAQFKINAAELFDAK